MGDRLLDVKNLQTVFHTSEGLVKAVDNATFHVNTGEIIGIVGESGSGKSVSMMSVLKLIPMPPGEVVGGQAIFDGQDILQYAPNSPEIRKVRGGGISMIFQEPMTSLNPVLTVGRQITESIMLHLGMNKADATARAIELLTMVGIPDAKSRIDYYPTQFSGGMRQRIMIAMAMSCNPKVLIADEATTALDVTTQEQILELLKDIVKKTNTALIIITHNLSIIARYAERIYVMYAGNVVEKGRCEELFSSPSHPYTMGLLKAIPRLDGDRSKKLVSIDGTPPNPAHKTGRCPFYERCHFHTEKCDIKEIPPFIQYTERHFAACWFNRDELLLREIPDEDELVKGEISDEVILELKKLSKYYPITTGIARKKVGDVKALDEVNLVIHKGETLGLVGESGCGKTTLAKTVLRLHPATSGQLLFKGNDIATLPERKLGDVRKEVQFIFQDPFGSLDPRQSAGGVIREAIMVHKLAKNKAECEERVDELFRAVGLDPSLKGRAPHEFSGGQRQRLCVAAALASDPSFIICDEPISALDVSIQAQIINLLIELQAKRGLTYLFIAHDLSVVRHISDRIAVMYLGRIVEIAKSDELYINPMHPYTQALLSAIPIPDPEAEKKRVHVHIEGEVPSLVNRPSGCVFHTRCPHATERCKNEVPELQDYNGHEAACFRIGEI